MTEKAEKARAEPLPVFLSCKETADVMRVKSRTLEKMRLQKRGPVYYRLGKGGRSKVIYSLVEVIKWMEEHKVG